MVDVSELKTFALKEDDAEALARPFRMVEGESPEEDDPFKKEIDPSLLSADDIVRYVEKTGMVAPFEQERNGKSRLKAASYEGGIGNKAYIFDPEKSEPRSILGMEDTTLIIPAHSIVFVECDLYFRLPPFIAVRFNLQIRLVHRGLLLGTGPLVDPGFWGKLCIPVHNLTDEDYEIPRDEGLIWVEFTKTTSYPELGSAPSNTNLEDIKAAIDKARYPYPTLTEKFKDRTLVDKVMRIGELPPKPVGIRSSIQTKFLDAEKNSKRAMKAAKTARRATLIFQAVGYVAILGLGLAVFQLWQAYHSDVTTKYDQLLSKITAQQEVQRNQTAQQRQENKELRERIDELERQIYKQQSTLSKSVTTPE